MKYANLCHLCCVQLTYVWQSCLLQGGAGFLQPGPLNIWSLMLRNVQSAALNAQQDLQQASLLPKGENAQDHEHLEHKRNQPQHLACSSVCASIHKLAPLAWQPEPVLLISAGSGCAGYSAAGSRAGEEAAGLCKERMYCGRIKLQQGNQAPQTLHSHLCRSAGALCTVTLLCIVDCCSLQRC